MEYIQSKKKFTCQQQPPQHKKFVTPQPILPKQKCCIPFQKVHASPRIKKTSMYTFNGRCDRFYEINKKTNLRATNLGYGNKYDFTRDSPCTPAPGAYEASTIFEESKKKNKGFGFGSGRGQMQASGFVKTNKNPGPGTYEIGPNRSSIYYSIKGKVKIDDRQQAYVPGPGAYEAPTNFSKTGLSFCSKYRNKSACRFGKEQKHKLENRKVPGPGTYDSSKTDFSPEGRYFYSRLQSAKNSKFGHAPRLTMQNRCQTPGPGNYRLPSQFGHYISRNAFKDTKNTLQTKNTLELQTKL